MSIYNPETWDPRWYDLADFVSAWSKDRSTKIGAVIVNDRQSVLSLGWNGFPRGVNDDIESRHDRPEKYLLTEHAERNAIYNAASCGIATAGATMYVKWYPCADCARGIIQSGISKLVCDEPDWNHERWGVSFNASRIMLAEAGVAVHYLNKKEG